SLDREILDKHVLKVTAYERLDPTVSSSVTVTVDVLDVQDNSPIFERDSYFADIREDAPDESSSALTARIPCKWKAALDKELQPLALEE
ncbi:hypothetical protein OSTOST_21304, partial [Ostertagia ostertagi]